MTPTTSPDPGPHHGPAATDRHLLLAFMGEQAPTWLLDELATGRPPGVTLFRHVNVGTATQTRELTDQLQAARPTGAPPLLVAADQETGQFLALGDDTTPFAGNLALGAVGDDDLAERVGRAIGRESLALGANVVYAPMCDLLVAPASPSSGIRTFGDDPAAVGRLAAAMVRGMQSAGVAATLKHFPGAGAVTTDTHHALGTLEASRPMLNARELVPFRAALAARPALVMSGHIAVPALTGRRDVPATLSREVMTDLLRGELGFDGVSITDALDMKALAQGVGQVFHVVAALTAGVDLLLCAAVPDDNARLRTGLRQALGARLLDPIGLATSVKRIDALRRHLGGRTQPDLAVVGCAEHRALADELARRAITLVRDDAGLLPLTADPDTEVLVLEPRPRDLTPADTSSTVAPSLAAALRSRLPGTVIGIVYDDPPSDAEVAAVVARARRAELVVFATSAARIDPAQAALADAVLALGVPTVAVVLRSPHDVHVLTRASTVLCSYGFLPPTTAALAAVLAGELEPRGTLPIRLEVAP